MLIDHHDQQIVQRKTQNLYLCFGTNVGTNQAKIEKISILLEFLRSLVSANIAAIRSEANKIHLLREERTIMSPIGSRTVKMLRDLLLLSRAACHSGERARQRKSTYA